MSRGASGEQLFDGERAIVLPVQTERYLVAYAVVFPRLVSGGLARLWRLVNFNHLAGQVHDPVLGDPILGVERSLDAAVIEQRRVGHHDDQSKVARSGMA